MVPQAVLSPAFVWRLSLMLVSFYLLLPSDRPVPSPAARQTSPSCTYSTSRTRPTLRGSGAATTPSPSTLGGPSEMSWGRQAVATMAAGGTRTRGLSFWRTISMWR